MKKFIPLIAALTFITPIHHTIADSKDQSAEEYVKQSTITAYLVILGGKKDYYQTLKLAKSISRKTGIPYDDQGMVFDKKKGLIVPEDSSDESYAGTYVHRRFNGEKDYISIEYSEGYDKLQRGFFIILGGIQESLADAQKMLSNYQKNVPDAYIRKTSLYMGCMH